MRRALLILTLFMSLSLLPGCEMVCDLLCDLFGICCSLKPDLTIRPPLRFEPKPPVEYGQALKVYADVLNQGKRASGRFRIAFFIDEREFASKDLVNVSPGWVVTAQGVLDTTGLRSERYEICVVVDVDNDVKETNEGNNRHCELVHIVSSWPEPLFIVTPSSDIKYLKQIDPETGKIIDSLPLQLPPGIEKIKTCTIAFSPDGKFYGVARNYDRLYTIDLTTGEITLIGSRGDIRPPGVKDVKTCGMAFDKEGRLFAIDWKNDILYQIDPVTGKGIRVIGPLGRDIHDNGMAVNFETGELYAIMGGKDGKKDKLLRIDKETGRAYKISSLGHDVDCVAMEFEPVTGRLYAIRNYNDLYKIDIETGEATLVKKDLPIHTCNMAARWLVYRPP